MLASFVSEGNALEITDEQLFKEWDRAMTLFENQVPMIEKMLEQSFREELGVLQKRDNR